MNLENERELRAQSEAWAALAAGDAYLPVFLGKTVRAEFEPSEWKLLKRVAQIRGLSVEAFVAEAAVEYAELLLSGRVE